MELEGVTTDGVAARLEQKEAMKQAAKEAKDAKKEKKEKPVKERPLPPPAPPPEEDSWGLSKEEEEELKSEALDKICAYRDRFKHLKSRNKVSFKSNLDEIYDELHWIETQLGQGQGGGHMEMAFLAAMYGVETATENYWNPLGLRLGGLGNTCKANMDQFSPLLDELTIKYGLNMVVSVEWRFALLVGTTIMTVHAANSDDPRVAQAFAKMNQMASDGTPQSKTKVSDKFKDT